ncbi:MAG: BCCT family transporter [Myxococcota bacterium]
MKVNPVVFFVSAGVILIFVVLAAAFTEPTAAAFDAIQAFIVGRFGWLYIGSVAFFLGFVIYLFFSRYGDIRLGKDDEEPAYSNTSWFAMLFSAGMGIGLLFYSVAEPILHMSQPPHADPGTVEAARQAMVLTFFHWGMHAWAIYIVVGLSLAYFSYRHDLPLTIRSAFYPLLGKRIHGAGGDVVEILAVFGTLFGIATSLGLGVMQINSGLAHLGLLDHSTTNQLFLIAGITLVATASVVSGLDRGIRRLSEMNLFLGLILVLFVFAVGPTVFLLGTFVQSVGTYLSDLVAMTFRTDAFVGTEWQSKWTMFYWGWWISWSPFVGMFIARVSRGRTIRQFIMGVLLVPTLLTFLWLVIFGNTAIHMELFEGGGIAAAVQDSVPVALYVMLERLPWQGISVTLATLVIATYFVTSSDSGSLVIDILTSGGEPNPPVAQRIFWALTEGAVASVLLLTGGLAALQTAAITTALPFCVVLIAMCVSLRKGLRAEHRPGRRARPIRELATHPEDPR